MTCLLKLHIKKRGYTVGYINPGKKFVNKGSVAMVCAEQFRHLLGNMLRRSRHVQDHLCIYYFRKIID